MVRVMFNEIQNKIDNKEKITANEVLTQLMAQEELDCDKHDGCYCLVRSILKCYSQLPSEIISTLDYNDLNLIYFITVGTWTYGADKKKELVDSSHLQDNHKQMIKSLIDETMSKAKEGFYTNSENGEPSFGMVGSGFKTFKTKGDNDSCIRFIKMCINILNTEEESELIKIADETLKTKIKGMKSASCSIILHCLKPNVFPIINSKNYLYKLLNIELLQPSELSTYIQNTQIIKKFRDEHFEFKNYRILDLMSTILQPSNEIDFCLIYNWLEDYGGKPYRKENTEIRKNGEQSKSEFDRFINQILGKTKIPFVLTSSIGWQNSGNTNDYHWAETKKEKFRKEFYSLSFSIDKYENDKLLFNIRTEIKNTDKIYRIKPDREKHESLRKLINYHDFSYCKIGLNNNKRFEQKDYEEIIKNDIDTDINKYQPFFNLVIDVNNYDVDEIIEEIKNPLEELVKAYDGIFDGTNEIQTKHEGSKKEQMINSRNIILYGPPGTGKTYNTIDYALRIIDEQFYTDNKDNRKVLKEKFDELKASGQIAFTTFHQSYGYEEFIEGIKPVVADDNTSSMTYEVKDGIFKLFCEKALKPNIEKQDASKLGLNSDPSFWKVSLKGTHENEIRTDCLNNGYIRIGYDSYGQDIDEATDFTKEGGKNVLTAFIYSMKIGDVILSCYTNNSIDAVGIVTGECQWRDDFAEYKRIRTVKWIKFPKPIEEIDKHNGNKTFTLGAVYKLNNIDKEWVYSLIVDKNYSTSKNSKKYVFIIDEINRGNISKIFGELITLIEDSKRIGEDEEMKCVLPYSNDENKPFGIPNNVYILGTMNTADRSISLIDTALRRRFQFIEMMPNPEIKELKDLKVEDISISDMIKTINERIEFLYDREHQIGHSYFMRLSGDGNNTIDNLSNIFKNNILPLLQEYFYDDYEKIRLVLGDNQKDNQENEFITKVESKSNNLFGNSDNDIEDKTIYRINDDAFDKIDSYKFMK